MKSVQITPSFLRGEIIPPPSKSLCHRAVIAAALAEGQSTIENFALSEDIIATIEGVQALGAAANMLSDKLDIIGGRFLESQRVTIDCRESGSTLRFLMPVGLLTDNIVTYIGKGNLGSRPLEPYLDIFKQQRISYSSAAIPIEVNGRLQAGVFELRGDISSQFITGLMFALPLLNSDSTITITGGLESKAYIDLTIDVLNSFGISITNNKYKSFDIKGSQRYAPSRYRVEGDYSQAAFWLAAGAMRGDIACIALNQNSKQGDRAIVDILRGAGAKIETYGDVIKVSSSNLHGFDADVSQCPDIAPILTVVAAVSQGTSSITGAARLRIKESDRLKAISTELNKLGANIKEKKDSLIIEGVKGLHGGEVDSWGDHRIAMSLAIASLKCEHLVTINNSSVIDKSYPSFYNDFTSLGGDINERIMG